MDSFAEKFWNIFLVAQTSGIRAVSLHNQSPDKLFSDERHRKDFYAACHRGYEKAQRRVFDEIVNLRNDKLLHNDEKLFRELILRRIIDSIAFAILGAKHHVVRRLVLHSKPHTINLTDSRLVLTVAEKLNAESRQTFALVADLSTFIHIADILRMDFREASSKISILEVKTGKVNERLLEHFDQHESLASALEKLRDHPDTSFKEKKQAERMVRQELRLEQSLEVIKTDQGTDIVTGRPIRLLGPEVELETYGEFLDKLCNEARKVNTSAASIDSCMHIGVGFADDISHATKYALAGLNHTIAESRLDNLEYSSIFNELKKLVPNEKDLLKVANPYVTNIYGMSCEPFMLWGLSEENIKHLVARNLQIYVALDITMFIGRARDLGLDATLTTRKETDDLAKKLGHNNVPTWGNRALRIGKKGGEPVTLLSGILSRLFNDLVRPSFVLENFLLERYK